MYQMFCITSDIPEENRQVSTVYLIVVDILLQHLMARIVKCIQEVFQNNKINFVQYLDSYI